MQTLEKVRDYDQIWFILRVQGRFKIRKFINIISHVKRSKDKIWYFQ